MKKHFIAAAVIIFLIVTALPFALEPIAQTFKPEIENALTGALGQNVTLGEVSARLFPTVGIACSDIEIGQGGENGRLQKLLLKTSLRGLLSGELTVETLTLEGLQVKGTRHADGSLTLAGITVVKGRSSPVTLPGTAQAPKRESGSAASSENHVSLRIKEAVLRDISVALIDLSTTPPRQITAKDLNLLLNITILGDTIRISHHLDGTQSEIHSSDLFTKRIGVPLTGTGVITKQSNGTLVAEGLALKLGTSSISASGILAPLEQLSAELKLEQLELKDFDQALPALASFSPAGRVTGNIHIRPEPAKRVPSLTGALSFTAVSANIPLSQGSKSLALEQLTGGVKLTGAGAEVDSLTLSLNKQLFHIRGRLNDLSSGEGDISVESQSLALEPLLVTLDRPLPLLTGGAIDDLEIEIKLAPPALLQSAKIKVGKLANALAPVSALSLPITFSPASTTADPFALTLFGGTLSGSSQLNKAPANEFKLSLTGTGFDLSQVSHALGASRVSLTGLVKTLGVEVQAEASNVGETVKGPVTLATGPGTIKGMNIVGEIIRGASAVPGLQGKVEEFLPEELIALVAGDSTAFDSLTLAATANGRAIQISELNLLHPQYSLIGGGAVTVGGSSEFALQFKLSAKATARALSQRPKLKLLLDRQGNLTIPLLVKHSHDKTLVLPNLDELWKNAARGGATDAAAKAVEKVAPGFGGAVRALDSLFK